MHMSRAIRLEGVVLKKQLLLGTAQSVTLFTRSHGKIRCIVRGSRVLTSRRSSHLQTGNLIAFDVIPHVSGAWYLASTSLRSAFSLLKESDDKVRVLYNILLVLDRLLPLEVREDMIYEMLLRAVIHLDRAQIDHDRLLFIFVRDICETLGYGARAVETYEDVHEVVAKVAEEDVRLLM